MGEGPFGKNWTIKSRRNRRVQGCSHDKNTYTNLCKCYNGACYYRPINNERIIKTKKPSKGFPLEYTAPQQILTNVCNSHCHIHSFGTYLQPLLLTICLCKTSSPSGIKSNWGSEYVSGFYVSLGIHRAFPCLYSNAPWLMEYPSSWNSTAKCQQDFSLHCPLMTGWRFLSCTNLAYDSRPRIWKFLWSHKAVPSGVVIISVWQNNWV